ncbi:DUF4129 domain-containing protein [bacterium]|nr:DUF4129 domain-containing protein [bacterium]
MRIRSRHYSLKECGGLFFAIVLSILGFELIDGIIDILFPSLYISSYAILNLLLAVIFGYFFQLSGSSLVGLIPYLPLSRFIFILGVKKDLGLVLDFFHLSGFYFPVNLFISLLFFSLSSSTAEGWALLFPQKEEYPPPLDSKRYYEWVTSPTHRIDRVPYLRRMAVHWISILFLVIIMLAIIWEWKREIPEYLWYIVVLYFLVYLIFIWYGILRARITEKELDGHIVSNKNSSRALFLPALILSSALLFSLILPWGYSPFSLSKLGDFLARLFQPKPVDYGTPLMNPLFWRFRILYIRPRISIPTAPERLYIPSYILWALLGIGVSFLLILLVKAGFFSKVLSILKEGFARLFYSIVELSKEFGFLKNIDTSNIRLPKFISIERPSTILGWIVYYYRLSLKIMAKKNLEKEKWETPYEYARRVESLMPEVGIPYWKITEIFVISRYRKVAPKKEWVSSMKERIREVKEKLK